MGVAEVIAASVVFVNVLWGIVYLVSRGFANETITVITALAGAVAAGFAAYARFRARPTGAEDRGDGGGQ